MKELYRIEDVAQKLHKSPRWLHDFLKKYPYYRKAGRTKLFSETDIQMIYEALPCHSSSLKENHHIGTSAAPSEVSLWMKAQALLTEKQPKRSGQKENMKSSKARFLGGK